MARSGKTTLQATLVGCIAILLWGLLAFLTQLAGSIPPFQLLATCFTLAFGVMLVKWYFCGQSIRSIANQPMLAWLVGIGGLFGYHAFYFVALSKAPVLEASLIAYLWPLLIVLFSAFLPGERLYIRHLIGVVLSLFGCWLLLGGADSDFDLGYLDGYLAAICCALIWAVYSVAGRWVSQVPTDTVGLFCGVCALLGWISHLFWEDTIWPQSGLQWLGIVGLALGPLGVAFFAWDYGVKRGDLQMLGVLSYAAPLISTGILILFTDIEATAAVYLACGAIVGGALVASMGGLLFRKLKGNRVRERLT
ncbi:DMT family transporter [Motiliproteus sp. MSK22-1]|uniref:aromatic amino acid exporter YddG n=1 Tax=Motiliproteus sp. MSK22-1 TaxID=1897630 RepID=UPI000978B4FE|nr:EamA family transporter [Motiliproteus sp. MSK22-1]OMH39716.1 hypothetical protein BGP75_01245 [Motiliproteus sp. MSK22-1]